MGCHNMMVEVAFALATEQKIIALDVPDDCTVYDAAVRSGIIKSFPQIDLETSPMGIFGKAVRTPKTTILKAGQRVEIYRPLQVDPKQARARRAAKMQAEKKSEL